MTKQILFLMSDTGGGHRAAAEAIRDALYIRYGRNQVGVTLLDVYREMMFPMNYMPEFYPWIVNNSKSSWGLGYHVTNTHRRATVISKSMYLTSGYLLRRMVRRNPAHAVVSVHSVITRPSMSAFMAMGQRPPFISVVTDLVSTHMFWYDKRVEKCLVPTEAAYKRGLACGLWPDCLRITGLPVHPRFNQVLEAEENPREVLGWGAEKPVILVVAGGEGMGPLYETARAVNARQLDCQLVVVAGRNTLLKEKLDAAEWNQSTHIYGFVTDMPRMMRAADILVTKAGPATITEAAIAGLPMILNDVIPGQEEGNVDYVVENDAGVYAPNPEAVALHVASWLQEGKSGLLRRSHAARRIGRPNAVWDIADEVWKQAHKPTINTHKRHVLRDIFGKPIELR